MVPVKEPVVTELEVLVWKVVFVATEPVLVATELNEIPLITVEVSDPVRELVSVPAREPLSELV